ncbi:methyltransferase domain-containing protein [Candidatus Peregrinibacteria bacterium]|nr:methyltransferase domain-containing protein [Candidatus Peregrinibacteria bacterium]
MPEQCLICGTRGALCRIRDMEMLLCPSCGFLWLKDKILPSDHYSNVAVGIDEAKTLRRRRNAIDRTNIIRRHLLLNNTCDVGTGEGLFLKVLDEHGYTGCCGIEPGADGVAHARSLGLDVICGSIDDVGSIAEARNIGVITLFHVIEHLDDPRGDIQKLHDALPSGGHLVIETPNLRGFSPRTIRDDWELFYPEHLWYFDNRTLPGFLKQFGFRIIAQGKRDFDSEGKGIPELLFRLGLRRQGEKSSKYTQPSGQSTSSSPPWKHSRYSFFRSMIRWFLETLVQWSGRVDYFWAIAQKP